MPASLYSSNFSSTSICTCSQTKWSTTIWVNRCTWIIFCIVGKIVRGHFNWIGSPSRSCCVERRTEYRPSIRITIVCLGYIKPSLSIVFCIKCICNIKTRQRRGSRNFHSRFIRFTSHPIMPNGLYLYCRDKIPFVKRFGTDDTLQAYTTQDYVRANIFNFLFPWKISNSIV